MSSHRYSVHFVGGLFLALAGATLVGSTLAVEPLFRRPSWERCEAGDDEAEEVEEFCYGPCDGCPPKTLLQWSRCATFGGGADLDEPLVTDRPDFTESSVTVGRGVLQIEGGYTYSYDREGADRHHTHSYPELLLRYGVLAEWLELRVAYNYGTFDEIVAGLPNSGRGSEDMDVGVKLALTPQACALPETGLILHTVVPTGRGQLSDERVLPGIGYLYSWELTERLSMAGNTLLDKAVDDQTDRTYYQFAQSLSFDYSLTERLGSYAEWYVLAPSGADTVRPEHYANGGFKFLINNNLQLDIFAGLGLNRAADDYFIGGGFAQRF